MIPLISSVYHFEFTKEKPIWVTCKETLNGEEKLYFLGTFEDREDITLELAESTGLPPERQQYLYNKAQAILLFVCRKQAILLLQTFARCSIFQSVLFSTSSNSKTRGKIYRSEYWRSQLAQYVRSDRTLFTSGSSYWSERERTNVGSRRVYWGSSEKVRIGTRKRRK